MVPMTLLASSSDRNSGLSSPQIRGNHSLGLIRSGPIATAVRKPSRLESAMLPSGASSDVRNSSSSWRLIGAALDNAFIRPAPFVRARGVRRRDPHAVEGDAGDAQLPAEGGDAGIPVGHRHLGEAHLRLAEADRQGGGICHAAPCPITIIPEL